MTLTVTQSQRLIFFPCKPRSSDQIYNYEQFEMWRAAVRWSRRVWGGVEILMRRTTSCHHLIFCWEVLWNRSHLYTTLSPCECTRYMVRLYIVYSVHSMVMYMVIVCVHFRGHVQGIQCTESLIHMYTWRLWRRIVSVLWALSFGQHLPWCLY